MRAVHVFVVLGLCAAGVRAEGQLEDPALARRAGAPPPKAGESAVRAREVPFLRRGFDPAREESGALAGKTVYVSAGHGWVWDANLGRWRTQRGNTHDLVEDFISAETIAQHLIPLLHDMGAYVVPVREADMSGELAIVDDAAAVVEAAATVETDGFALAALPITGATNPFAGRGSRLAVAGADPRVVASWTFAPAADVEGFVYLSWVQGADRAPDAHYVIHHAGGDTHVRVDQRRHGSTWVLIGSYRFSPADPPERRTIELLGDSATAGARLSIDAVRVGGGPGRVDRGMGASGRPAFEDGARYQAQWNGAPSTVWDYAAEDGQDDVGTRSRFSAWEHEAGEDAVYVAWHTNAPSPARGTSSFAYGPNAFGTLADFTGVPGSLELMDAIHRELISDLRDAWDPAWQDRAQHTAYFGEVNPSHNPEMPATLIEVAFHDTLEDAAALREPRFRHLASRAIAQGIARYFAQRDGTTLVLPPAPPTAVTGGLLTGGDGWTVSWSPPAPEPAGGDAPTEYVVYLSPDGRAFDEGHVTTERVYHVDAAVGAGMHYARVVARNAGGRSRPSPVVGARTRTSLADVLVVTGFTRLDGDQLFREDLSSRALGTIDRAYEDRINDGSHGARIGAALDELGYGFQIATVDSVRAVGDVRGYRAVIWLGGEEAAPLTAEDRTMLTAFLDGGGALVLTGTDAARALATDDPDFLGRLGAVFLDDDAGTYELTGVQAPLAGSTFRFDDTGPGGYDADAPDVLDGPLTLLAYPDGRAAATVTNQFWRAAVFGFPIETVPAVADRARILHTTLVMVGVEAEPEPDAEPPDLSGGCCDAGADPRTVLVPLLGVLLVLTRRRRVTNMRPS